MAAESEADRQAMLDADDFGVEAKWSRPGKATITFKAVFDDQYLASLDTGIAGIEATDPQVTCSDADIAGMRQGDKVTIREQDYQVASIQQDGTGVTLLQMHKQ